ncbi:MAG: hypothetical protein J4F50_07550 [Acidimicrobiia bacterium]|nr:hypothetical protein [Acidimicrobiia bacterium]
MEVEVRLPPSDLDRYHSEGRIIPEPVRATGIIDTAAERTCVSAAIVDRLLLEPTRREDLATASGPRQSGIYYLMLQVGWREGQPPAPIPVTAYDAEVMGAEVLVGLDVLRHGRLVLRGPEGQFELFLPPTARTDP